MSITRSSFGEYYLYTIENAQGARLEVTDLGATVRSIVVPDRNGVMSDVVLGYDTPREYLDNDGYFGAAVGRYANRAKWGLFPTPHAQTIIHTSPTTGTIASRISPIYAHMLKPSCAGWGRSVRAA